MAPGNTFFVQSSISTKYRTRLRRPPLLLLLLLLPFVTDNLNAEDYVGIGALRSAYMCLNVPLYGKLTKLIVN